LDSDQDVIVSLEDAHRQMTISIRTEHVKGHQDKDKAFEQLTIPEKFNLFADNLATYALDLQLLTKAEPVPLVPPPRGSPYLTHVAKSLLRGISAEGRSTTGRNNIMRVWTGQRT
jgi:hypothetical protein